MELTAENTAIVVDSTADFPEAPRAVPELAGRAAVRALRRRELPRLRRALARRSSTRGCAPSTETPSTSQPTPGDFLSGLRGARRLRADPLDSHRGQALGDDRERARRGRASSAASACGRSTRRAPRRRSRCSGSRSSGGSSAARATRRSTPSSSATAARPACSSPSTRSSTSRAGAASAALARGRASC